MVRSPCTLEISSESNLAPQRTIVTPSSNGKITNVGNRAMANNLTRTDRAGLTIFDAGSRSAMPGGQLAINGFTSNTKAFCRLLPIVANLIHYAEYMSAFYFFQRDIACWSRNA